MHRWTNGLSLVSHPTRTLVPTSLFLDDAEYFFLAHDQKLLAVDLDLSAGIFTEKYAVSGLNVQRKDLTFVVGLAFANCDDFAFHRFFFGTSRNDDSTTNGFPFFDSANEDAIVER